MRVLSLLLIMFVLPLIASGAGRGFFGNGRLVVDVYDGDTIELYGGEKIRYLGIDTPEVAHEDRGAECMSLEAKKRNRELVMGKRVTLEKDKEDKDKYGRSLRYVYMEGMMVNEVLLKEGFAKTLHISPNMKYKKRLDAAAGSARNKGLGVWGEGC